MKNEIERLNFVIWAKTRYPGFTTNAQQYARANRAWRAVALKDRMVDKVIRTCYN
jgi:uridylate kinase